MTYNSVAVRRGASSVLVAALIPLFVWCLLTARSVGVESSYYRWLAVHGSRVDVEVVELGLAGADGSALQVWVSNPGHVGCNGDELFIDLSRGKDVITRESQRFPAVVSCSHDSPMDNPPDGVSASALKHSFVADYLREMAPAGGLILIDVGCIVALRRFWRPNKLISD